MDQRIASVLAAVAAAGIEPTVRMLDAEVKTAAAAAEHLGCQVGAIANSLVFACDGEPLLVMASGAARVDTGVIASTLGATAITRATPRFVRDVTGQVIGGVAPTGHPSPLPTVVDEALADHPLIWAGAGTADSMLSLTYPQLLLVTRGSAMRVR